MKPQLIKGNHHKDLRGTVCFNNDFDTLQIRRVYTIENTDTVFIRAWQGHRTEQRWFTAVAGSFTVKLIEIDHWEHPSGDLPVLEFNLDAQELDVLHVPRGFVSSIQAKEEGSKLMVFADHTLGEVKDEHRFPQDYFHSKQKS